MYRVVAAYLFAFYNISLMSPSIDSVHEIILNDIRCNILYQHVFFKKISIERSQFCKIYYSKICHTKCSTSLRNFVLYILITNIEK